MKKFKSENHGRLTVKYIDTETNEVLFSLNNRDHINIGELFSETYSTLLINQELPEGKIPKSFKVLVVQEFNQI